MAHKGVNIMTKKETLTLTIDARNLECVRDTVKVINNNIYENHGCVSVYDRNLLQALLGEGWYHEYSIGEMYLV